MTGVKKKDPEFRKLFVSCVAVLSCIAVAAGLLLGFFHQLTFISAEEEAARAAQKISEIVAGDFQIAETDVQKSYGEGEIGYFFSDETKSPVLYAIVVRGHKGYGGDIEFYLIFEADKLVKVKVGSNKETPGISDNALKNDSFMNQFVGLTADELYSALAEDGSIDSAAGATFSSRGTKNAMLTAAQFMRNYLKGGELS